MLHQYSLTQKGHLIVESYVTRNQALLDETESFDYVYDIMGNTPLHAAVIIEVPTRPKMVDVRA